MSAQEFTELLESGWVTVGLVLGAAVTRLEEDSNDLAQRKEFAPGHEVNRLSGRVRFVRKEARAMLMADTAGVGADGVVIARSELKVYEFKAQRFVEARFIGTAIAAFGPAGPQGRSVSIMRLMDESAPRKGP